MLQRDWMVEQEQIRTDHARYVEKWWAAGSEERLVLQNGRYRHAVDSMGRKKREQGRVNAGLDGKPHCGGIESDFCTVVQKGSAQGTLFEGRSPIRMADPEGDVRFLQGGILTGNDRTTSSGQGSSTQPARNLPKKSFFDFA